MSAEVLLPSFDLTFLAKAIFDLSTNMVILYHILCLTNDIYYLDILKHWTPYQHSFYLYLTLDVIRVPKSIDILREIKEEEKNIDMINDEMWQKKRKIDKSKDR